MKSESYVTIQEVSIIPNSILLGDGKERTYNVLGRDMIHIKDDLILKDPKSPDVISQNVDDLLDYVYGDMPSPTSPILDRATYFSERAILSPKMLT